MNRSPKPYSDPYVAGVGLGAVLLGSYVLVGRGLGASGAFSSVVAAGAALTMGTERASSSAAMSPYLTHGFTSPLHDWLVLELLGAAVGGFLSAYFAGRLKVRMERGAHITSRSRLVWAVFGGVLMGFGAKLARGCTSGQALTGGALLSVGSWIFIATCFAAAYLLSPFAKRLWL